MRRIVLLACLLSVALLWAAPARASMISFTSQTVDLGSPLVVDIVLSGNTSATLTSFAFNFSFDPNFLTFDNVENGELFPDEGFDFLVDSGFGIVLNAPSTGLFQGNGLLARLSFTAIATGDPLLILADAFLTDDSVLTDPNAPPIAVDIDPASKITIGSTTPVPEPSTLGLLGLGVLSLARRFRRRPTA